METLKVCGALLVTNKLADGTDNDVNRSRFNLYCGAKFGFENKSHISKCPVSPEVKRRGEIEGHCLNDKSIRDMTCTAYAPEGPEGAEGQVESSAEHDEALGRLLNDFKQGAATGPVVDEEAGVVVGGEEAASFDRSNLSLFRENMVYGINRRPTSLALSQSIAPAIGASEHSRVGDRSKIFNHWIAKCNKASTAVIHRAKIGIYEVWSESHATCQSRMDTFNEQTLENMKLVFRGFYKPLKTPLKMPTPPEVRCFVCDNVIFLNENGRVLEKASMSNAKFGHDEKCPYSELMRRFITHLEKELATCYAHADSPVTPVVDLEMDSSSSSDSQISSDDQSVLSAGIGSSDTDTFGKVSVSKKGADKKSLEGVLELASMLDSSPICAICREKDKVNVTLLPCKHRLFCEDCLWIFNEKQNSICPVCRVPIQEYDIAYYDA